MCSFLLTSLAISEYEILSKLFFFSNQILEHFKMNILESIYRRKKSKILYIRSQIDFFRTFFFWKIFFFKNNFWNPNIGQLFANALLVWGVIVFIVVKCFWTKKNRSQLLLQNRPDFKYTLFQGLFWLAYVWSDLDSWIYWFIHIIFGFQKWISLSAPRLSWVMRVF